MKTWAALSALAGLNMAMQLWSRDLNAALGWFCAAVSAGLLSIKAAS